MPQEIESHTAREQIEPQLAALREGARRLVTLSLAERQRLLRACVAGVEKASHRWLEAAWGAKRIRPGEAARAEDMLNGPAPTLRYLHLLDRTLGQIATTGRPKLPGAPRPFCGRQRVPVFPTDILFDRILFGPLRADVLLPDDAEPENLFGDNVARIRGEAGDSPCITAVLGAGNVSSIPATDALTKIFQGNQAVALKMNPVNAYVGPVFEQAFAPLLQADLLRIFYGDAQLGADLISSQEVDRVHITGSDRTHDAIVWGSDGEDRTRRKAAGLPFLQKPITSELGNVSPWIIVPGKYSEAQLRFQAENIAASITNNASFNCIATKMLITARSWLQREQFLQLLRKILDTIPTRFAYYPGAAERYARFSGKTPENMEQLPWTLLLDIDPTAAPELIREESFVCVCGETTLGENSPAQFLRSAVEFCNHQMWGTLAAAITVPREFQQRERETLDQALVGLKYGIVGLNQWPGVAFALMSNPWGAFPGSTLEDIQSGSGMVHNTYLLDRPEKTILSSPLTVFPKPIWFSTHGRPERVADSLLRLYFRPSISRLPAVLLNAVRG